jgi:hypothetical protein
MLSIQGASTDNIIYEKSGLNLGFNIACVPSTEVEAVTTPTLFTSKVLIDNAGISLKVSDTINTLPLDVLKINNAGIDCFKDENIEGTNKVHFSGNNYLQNDANHNLNLHLSNNRNFVADTGNDQSSYEFEIEGNPVLKMTRDLTSNPLLPVNLTQVSSQKLSVKDDSVAGGYIGLERTGASGVLAGYVNFYNNVGRLFYTGFNDGPIQGNPLHYFENICKSYTFKNSFGPIMKLVSHSGTLSAVSNYVEIDRRLKCPTLQMYAPHTDGSFSSTR